MDVEEEKSNRKFQVPKTGTWGTLRVFSVSSRIKTEGLASVPGQPAIFTLIPGRASKEEFEVKGRSFWRLFEGK